MSLRLALVTVAILGTIAGALVATSTSPGDRPVISGKESNAASYPEYPPKLQGLHVTRFAIDGGNQLWLPKIRPTGENVLYRYNPATDDLQSYALPNDPGGGWFVGIDVHAASGRVWIAWDDVLVMFDPSTAHFTRYPLPETTGYAVRGVTGKWVRHLLVTDDETLWLSRNNSASLLQYAPAASTFLEHGLEGFGVPDRIRLAPDGRLWLTLARDPVTNLEQTSTGIFDPRPRSLLRIPEKSSDIAIYPTGAALLAGNSAGVLELDRAGVVVTGKPTPFTPTSDDLVRIAPEGRLALANRYSSALASFDPTDQKWTLFKLRTRVELVHGPFGYSGPPASEVTAEVTDLRFAGNGDLWAVVATNGEVVRISR